MSDLLNDRLDWGPVLPLLEPEACDPGRCKVNCCRIGIYLPDLGTNYATEYHCKYLDPATSRCTIYETRLSYEHCFALADLLEAGDCTRSCTCASHVDLQELGYRGKEEPPADLVEFVRRSLFAAFEAMGGPPPNVNDRAIADYQAWLAGRQATGR